MTPDTLFQAASLSKPVAAMVALRLVELGALSLDEDVNLKLRSWKVPASAAADGVPVTLRRLLSHTAGLTVGGFPGYASGAPVPSLVQLLDGTAPANSAAVRIDAKPGTIYRYSGGGYEVMQLLVEDVTRKPFAEVARTLVLTPLGMTRSTFEQPLTAAALAASAVGHDEKGAAIAGKRHTYPELAAAGLWTTPSEYAQVILEMQTPGRVLKPATADTMLTPVLEAYGLGFGVEETGGQPSFAHGGSNRGFKCQVRGYRRQPRGAVVMTNADLGGRLANEVMRAIAVEYRLARSQAARAHRRARARRDATHLRGPLHAESLRGDRRRPRHRAHHRAAGRGRAPARTDERDRVLPTDGRGAGRHVLEA